jgi:hypothetical protein
MTEGERLYQMIRDYLSRQEDYDPSGYQVPIEDVELIATSALIVPGHPRDDDIDRLLASDA